MDGDNRLIYEAYTDQHLLEENFKGAILAGLLCALGTQTACQSVPADQAPLVKIELNALERMGAVEAMKQDYDLILRGRDDLLTDGYDKQMAKIIKDTFGAAPDPIDNEWQNNVRPQIIDWGHKAQDDKGWPGWGKWAINWLSRHPEHLPKPEQDKPKSGYKFSWHEFINDIVKGVGRYHDNMPFDPGSWK